MATTAHAPTIKVVGTNGQISLGKQYAGRQVLVEEYEPGVWLVRTATIVPDNERWLREPQAAADLQAAMAGPWPMPHRMLIPKTRSSAWAMASSEAKVRA